MARHHRAVAHRIAVTSLYSDGLCGERSCGWRYGADASSCSSCWDRWPPASPRRHRHRPSLSLRSSSTPWSRPSRRRWPTSCGHKARRLRPPANPASASPAADRTGALGTFRGRLNQVIAALPQANAALKRLPQALDESATGGRGTGSFLAALLAAVVAALAVEAIVRALLARPKNRLAPNAVPEKGMRSLDLPRPACAVGWACRHWFVAGQRVRLGRGVPRSGAATPLRPGGDVVPVALARQRPRAAADLQAGPCRRQALRHGRRRGAPPLQEHRRRDVPVHLPSFHGRAVGALEPVQRRHCRVTNSSPARSCWCCPSGWSSP